jgi:lipopolysaccharide exporter
MTAEGREEHAPALGDAAIAGARWLTISRLTTELVQLGVVVVLARLISPAEYGRLAIALVLLGLAISLTGEGFGNPVVQRPKVDRAFLGTATLLSIGFGLALTLLALLALPLAIEPVFGGRTAELVRTMSPIFLILGLRVIPYALLQRRLAFSRISLIELSTVPLTAGVSIALAAAGLGAQAVVLGILAGNAVALVVAMALARPVRPCWDRTAMRELVGFGLPAALSGLVWTSYRNIDYVILGARLSAAQVGFYYRAFQLGVEYQGKLGSIMMAVAFPVYSRAADTQQRLAMRAKVVRSYTVLLFPVLAMFVVLAPVLVPWLFGARWESSVVPAQILAAAGAMMAVGSLIPPLALAAGRPKVLLCMNLINICVFATVVFLAAPGGIVVVALAVVAVTSVNLAVGYEVVMRRLLRLPVGLRNLPRDIAPALTGCVALAAAALGVLEAAAAVGAPDVLAMVPAAGAGALAYLLTLRAFHPRLLREVAAIVARIVGFDRPRNRGAGQKVSSAVPVSQT